MIDVDDLLGRAGIGEMLRDLISQVERAAPSLLRDAAAEIAADDTLSPVQVARALFRIELQLHRRVLVAALPAMIDVIDNGGASIDLDKLIAAAARETRH